MMFIIYESSKSFDPFNILNKKLSKETSDKLYGAV